MLNLPQITIELIKASCLKRSFERGEEYYRNGAIIRPIIHISPDDSCIILTAECEGTSDQNYRVSVFLNEDGILDANCSCPYDWGGYCKHIVALLLVYFNEKERFSKACLQTKRKDGEEATPHPWDLQPDLEEIAAELSSTEKEDLVVLFLAMLKEEPGLLKLIRTYLACFQGYFSAKFLPDEDVIKQSYLLSVQLAFGGGFLQDEEQKKVLSKLHALKASAQKKAQQGDFYYATLILHALILGCLSRYEYTQNPRDIFNFVSECISLLQVAFSEANLKKEKRQKWLLDIFECRNKIETNLQKFTCSQNACPQAKRRGERCDVSCPIEIETKLDELILSVCKEEDVPVLLPMAQLEKELLDKERYCPFQRRNLIKFILRLYEIAKRISDYLNLAYSEGEGLLYVQKLIKRKEIDKAISYIKEKPLNADEYFPLAETLESLGLKDKVPFLMEIGLMRACDSKSVLVCKFAEYFEDMQNYKLALSALVACFEFTSEIRILKKIRRVANRLGKWTETKEKLTSKLFSQKKYELLTKIYLDDGEIENAIATLRKIHQKPIRDLPAPQKSLKTGKDARIISLQRNFLMRKVASESEKSHPKEAIILYKKLAETQIAKVDTKAYKRAFKYLKKIKNLYTFIGEEAKWQDYIAELRRENAKKIAFLEEIREL